MTPIRSASFAALCIVNLAFSVGATTAATMVNWTGAGGLEPEGTDVTGNSYVLSDSNTVTPSIVFQNNNGATLRGWHNDAHGGAIRLDMNLTEHTDYIEFRMNFGTAVTGLTFGIEDIDQGATWDDNVLVTYNININAYQNSSLWSYESVTPSIGPNQAGDGWEGTFESSNQDFGTLNFDFGNVAVDDVRIQFSSANNPAPTNPDSQHIHISDLNYLGIVPEPSSLTFLLASALALGGRRRT